MVMKSFSYLGLLLLVLVVFLMGCSGTSIKDDFCGVHINYQYCKCAFHNQYCENVGMTKSEAHTYVYAQYEIWLQQLASKEYGVVEKDGNLYLNAKPGEVLSITTADLPEWARGQIATVGNLIVVVGPPDSIIEGDTTVLLDGQPIARVNDTTAQGGVIVEGSDNIFVNGVPVALINGFVVSPMISGGRVPYVGGPIIGEKVNTS